jgi:polyhydroxyalkanoate synthesis regulator phasin
MLDIAKKAAMIGTGLALAATDKIQGVVDNLKQKEQTTLKESPDIFENLVEETKKTGNAIEKEMEKVLTDVTAFWLFTNWTDEMEDQLEKMVAFLLRKLNIPEQRELEDIKARIERLEKEQVRLNRDGP